MGSSKQCLEASKTKALTKAKDALKTYLQEHNLDPRKNWMIDKVHGKAVTKLVRTLNLERDKVMAKYPFTDAKHERKRMEFHHRTKLKYQEIMATKAEKKKAEKAKAAKKAAEKEAKAVAQVPVENPAPKKEKKAKAEKSPRTLKYEYPLIDGREMTAAEKKQYRIKMRKEAAGGEAKPKKEKPVKETPAPEAKPSKKDKKAKKEAAGDNKEKKVKKVKKIKKVED